MLAVLDGPVRVAYDLVTGLASALHPLAGGLSAALAIVVFTAAVRLALHPLGRRQAAADRARRRLAPQVEALRERHRDDPLRAHQEITALYRAEGTSALAGFGPALLQMPVFAVVYRLFLSPAVGGHANLLLANLLLANLLLANTLFGVPLGNRWLLSPGAFGPHGLVFLALFVLLASVAWWTSRRMYAGQPAPAGPLGRVLRLLPFGTVAIAAYVPLAAGLYLLTSTAWSTAERALLWRGVTAG